MPRLRLIVMISAGFVAGITFVLACGNGSGVIDAGADARAACTTCEPPITASRYYVVRNSSSVTITNGSRHGIGSSAPCNAGDVLVGGGCWILDTTATDPIETFDNQHYPIAFGPGPAVGSVAAVNNTYYCEYGNNDQQTFTVVASAICFHPVP